MQEILSFSHAKDLFVSHPVQDLFVPHPVSHRKSK